MKLGKAIEILSDHHDKVKTRFAPDLKDAIKLGIEALKRLQQLRLSRISWLKRGPLSGETEE